MDAVVPDRLVIPAAAIPPLVVPMSMVAILEGLRPTVSMLGSPVAGLEEPCKSPPPIECVIDDEIDPEVPVAVRDKRLVDWLSEEEGRSAARAVDAARLRSP